MHPLWILFSLIGSIKELVLTAIFFIVIIDFNFNSTFIKLGIVAITFYLIYKVLSIILDWKHFKYSFTNKELCIYEGRFIKKKRLIPLEYIQGVNRKTSFIYQIFGLTTLLINTGSSANNSSVKLEAISSEEAIRIQGFLDQLDSFKYVDEQNQTISVDPTSEKKSERKHYEVTSKEIFIASIISLRFILFIAVLYSIYSEISPFIAIDGYINIVTSFFQQSWLLTLFGIILFLILSIVYGISKTYFQYRNFAVTADSHRISIQKGMFNKTEFSIPKEKVQAINLSASFIQKIFRLVKVKIISISDMGDDEMETSNILFPFIDKKRAVLLISEVLPEFHVESGMTNIPKTSIFVKIVRSSYLWILGPAIIYYFRPQLWYISLAIFVIVIISQFLSGLQSKYKLNTPFIQFQKGGLLTRLFVTKRIKIEELKMTESWLQRMFGLATIQISTRASPIKVSKISDIPKGMALQYYQWYTDKENSF